MTPEIWKAILEFGCFGVLAWIVWFVFSKGIPAFVTALEKQRQEFLSALEKQREGYSKEIITERAEMTKVVNSVDKLTDIVTSHDKAMREAHSRELQSMIEAAIFRQHNQTSATSPTVG